MSSRLLSGCVTVLAAAFLATSASAKDKQVGYKECPPPVQLVIKKYEEQGKLEEIGLDEKKKSGGPAVYEVKFALTSGRRVEVHINAAGEVLEIQEKKAKKVEVAP